jgi:plasmid stabilization system protein ParE
MRRIVWSPRALDDIGRFRDFIRDQNLDAARRAIAAIRAGVGILRTNPAIGRPVRSLNSDFRERLIDFGASVYVMRYRIEDSNVTILTIWHGRESGL